MPKLEEDVVEAYFKLNNYLTSKNITFPAIRKRKGGKGRGEIDILAIKIKGARVKEAIRAEVSAGMAGTFPFRAKGEYKHADAINKMLKKFFKGDADYKIKDFFGKRKYKSLMITNKFNKNTEENLKKSLGRKLIGKIKIKNGRLIFKIKYKKVKEIEVIPFDHILNEIENTFKRDKKMITMNFQDQTLHWLQYLFKERQKGPFKELKK